VEVLMESNFLDNGQMVYDFGLTKLYIKDIVDSFDHAITLWSGDDRDYLEDMKRHSKRWIELPVSPSAEQFCRVFFILIDKILNLTLMRNGEKGVSLNSIIVHETDTGYAQGFREDAYNKNMGVIELENIIFSNQIKSEWRDKNLLDKLLKGEVLVNPKEV
jgi:6-pyruvoyltetrahydropterin/6-carboxytetrahydropterin synthase